MTSWMNGFTLGERKEYAKQFVVLFAVFFVISTAIFGYFAMREDFRLISVAEVLGMGVLCALAFCFFGHGIYYNEHFIEKRTRSMVTSTVANLVFGGAMTVIGALLFLPCYVHNLWKIKKISEDMWD